MMTEREFYQSVEQSLREYLPEEYMDAQISLTTQVKANDMEQTGVVIRISGEAVTPIIYLGVFYEQYQQGRDMNEIMPEIAQTRIHAIDGPIKEIDVNLFKDYENIRPKLQMRVYDTERNEKRLDGIVHHSYGDFTAAYSIMLGNAPDHSMGVMITPQMLSSWGISKKKLHDDTILADLSREPVLAPVQEMMMNAMDGSAYHNYLQDKEEKPFVPDENEGVQMLCLTNGDRLNGAGLILNSVIQEKVANICEGNYYVLPSSVHEVLIVPDKGDMPEVSARVMNEMVRDINLSVVSPQDILSDKVQYYDAKSRTLMNAVAYEREHEKLPDAQINRGKAI